MKQRWPMRHIPTRQSINDELCSAFAHLLHLVIHPQYNMKHVMWQSEHGWRRRRRWVTGAARRIDVGVSSWCLDGVDTAESHDTRTGALVVEYHRSNGTPAILPSADEFS